MIVMLEGEAMFPEVINLLGCDLCFLVWVTIVLCEGKHSKTTCITLGETTDIVQI